MYTSRPNSHFIPTILTWNYDLSYRAKFQGAGCSALVYHWAVEYVGDSLASAEVDEDIANLTAKLNGTDTGIVDLTDADVCESYSFIYLCYN